MKTLMLSFLCLGLLGCNENKQAIQGTWKMVYAETVENDSVKIKNLSNTTFIKIINQDHFAFFNQENHGSDHFYGGAGTYSLKGSTYNETLKFTQVESLKNHMFSFSVSIKGDTLIQSGLEHVKEAGINRTITEKYVRVN
ncbi:hypothetical protein [Cognatitamlana onchidii]|uniref:hypothetical protein n=1 Tax=Cognatitamlana onchidii TaxID=2562860 RepID=UPI0010A5C75B|nr:hypothetical protein [Algibacter onchidii]